ncbi:MAG TPA: hypothetical protein VH420_00170 [Gaiellaceae bacterium]|jgi:hypothetical protein
MSVTQPRRNRTFLLTAVAALAVAFTAAAATAPAPVKIGPRNEVGPAASDDWFAWSKSREKQTSPFDLYAQQTGHKAFRVNPKNTQAYAGGIDGATLVYQLIRGSFADSSDLRLYDLTTRHLQAMPAGVNTPKWECCATISGGWLLYSRGQAYSPDRQLVLLRNLETGEQRVLDQLKNRNGLVSAGQLNGTFAVWAKCNPYPRCQIMRYDLASASTTALPSAAGKVVYSPSVNELGTVYYGQSKKGCGKSVQLVKQKLTGPPEVIARLPQGRDLDVSFAHRILTKPPGDVITTRVYYDSVRCRTHSWNIYSVDDSERIPLPSPPPG